MPDSYHVSAITSFHQDQLAQLAELARQGYQIITPNTRLATYIREQLIQRQLTQPKKLAPTHQVIWQEADIQSYDAFVNSSLRQSIFEGVLPATTILDSAGEQWLWELAIEHVQSEAQISEDVYSQNINIQLLSNRGAASEAMRAYALLLNWQVDIDEHQFALNSYIDSRTYLVWQENFEKLAQSKAVMTLLQAQAGLIQCRSKRQQTNTVKVVAVGFQLMSPLQESLLESLTTGAWQRLDLIENALDIQEKLNDTSVVDPRQDIDCFEYRGKSSEDEWQSAAQWIWRSSAENPDQRFAVVIPSLTKNRLAIERIFDEEAQRSGFSARDYNISAGVPLNRVVQIKHWFWLLHACFGSLPRDQMLELLWSPFIFNEDYKATRVELSKALFEAGESEYQFSDLSSLLDWARSSSSKAEAFDESSETESGETFESLLLKANKLTRSLKSYHSESGRTLTAWIEKFKQFDVLFGFSQHRSLSSDEFQQLEMFNQALTHLQSNDGIYGQLSARHALAAIDRYCQARVYQAQTIRNDTRLMPEVLGVLEAAGQRFDAIWLCEMSDQEWPPVVRTNGLLPFGLQASMGMPGSHERELQYATIQTQQLCFSADKVTISFRRHIDEVETRRSPFFDHYFENFQEWPIDVCSENESNQKQANIIDFIETIMDDKGLPLCADSNSKKQQEIAAIRIRGGAAALADQAQLPLLGYFKHRLDIRPLANVQAGLTAAERGVCLHSILDKLWTHYKNQSSLLSASESDVQEFFCNHIDRVLLELNRARFKKLAASELAIEKLSLSVAIDAWLSVERQRQDFEVVATEQNVEYFYQKDAKNYIVKGRVDRVDRVDGLGHLIIDYKSGKSSTVGWFDEELSNPQLPLYALAVQNAFAAAKELNDHEMVNAIAYAKLKFGEIALQGTTKDPEEGNQNDVKVRLDKGLTALSKNRYFHEPEWSALQKHWRTAIHLQLDSIIEGEADMDILAEAQESSYQPILRSGFYQQQISMEE